MKKFAVFDIDGTVVRDALFFQIVDELIADGHLPRDSRAHLDAKFEAYRERAHSNAFNEYAQEAVQTLFGNMANLKVKDYRKAVDKVVSRTKNYTYVYTRDLINKLRKRKYFLIALSGSEMYAVQQFASHYGFDVIVGENYLEKDGLLTGEVESVVHRKDEYLKQLVDKHNLTSSGSIAIGDSYSDGKMLKIVERPIAFNPEQRLFALAQEHGWEIVIERKNMIYELEHHDGSYILAKANV